jgi:hypothetical protein
MPLTPVPVRWKMLEKHLRRLRLTTHRVLSMCQQRGKNVRTETGSRPPLSWPVVLRAVRGWVEPWIMLRRVFRAWGDER